MSALDLERVASLDKKWANNIRLVILIRQKEVVETGRHFWCTLPQCCRLIGQFKIILTLFMFVRTWSNMMLMTPWASVFVSRYRERRGLRLLWVASVQLVYADIDRQDKGMFPGSNQSCFRYLHHFEYAFEEGCIIALHFVSSRRCKWWYNRELNSYLQK